MNMLYIPVKIQKVLKLVGALCSELKCPAPIYAYVHEPVKNEGSEVTYASLSRYESNCMIRLGEINPETRVFKPYSSCMGDFTLCKRAQNGVIQEVRFSPEELNRLKKLEDILAIKGISVTKEYVPENK